MRWAYRFSLALFPHLNPPFWSWIILKSLFSNPICHRDEFSYVVTSYRQRCDTGDLTGLIEWYMILYHLVSVHLIEKWCHFVSSKTLLRFRGRVRVRVRVRVKVRVSVRLRVSVRVRAGVSVNTFSSKCSRSVIPLWLYFYYLLPIQHLF